MWVKFENKTQIKLNFKLNTKKMQNKNKENHFIGITYCKIFVLKLTLNEFVFS